MEKPSNFLKVTKLLGRSYELISSLIPVCAMQESKVPQSNGDHDGLWDHQSGFEHLLMHFLGPMSLGELLHFPEPQILHPPHWG